MSDICINWRAAAVVVDGPERLRQSLNSTNKVYEQLSHFPHPLYESTKNRKRESLNKVKNRTKVN